MEKISKTISEAQGGEVSRFPFQEVAISSPEKPAEEYTRTVLDVTSYQFRDDKIYVGYRNPDGLTHSIVLTPEPGGHYRDSDGRPVLCYIDTFSGNQPQLIVEYLPDSFLEGTVLYRTHTGSGGNRYSRVLLPPEYADLPLLLPPDVLSTDSKYEFDFCVEGADPPRFLHQIPPEMVELYKKLRGANNLFTRRLRIQEDWHEVHINLVELLQTIKRNGFSLRYISGDPRSACIETFMKARFPHIHAEKQEDTLVYTRSMDMPEGMLGENTPDRVHETFVPGLTAFLEEYKEQICQLTTDRPEEDLKGSQITSFLQLCDPSGTLLQQYNALSDQIYRKRSAERDAAKLERHFKQFGPFRRWYISKFVSRGEFDDRKDLFYQRVVLWIAINFRC